MTAATDYYSGTVSLLTPRPRRSLSGPFWNLIQKPPQTQLHYRDNTSRNNADVAILPRNGRQISRSKETKAADEDGARAKQNSQVRNHRIRCKCFCNCGNAALDFLGRIVLHFLQRVTRLHFNESYFANGFTRSIDSLKSLSFGASVEPF